MPIGLLAGVLHRLGERERAAQVARLLSDSLYPVWGRVLYHLLCSDIEAAATQHWPALAQMMNLPCAG
jgi:hypothetical protein